MEETLEAEDREKAEEEEETDQPSDDAESPLETDDDDDGGPIIYDADAEDAREAEALRVMLTPDAGGMENGGSSPRNLTWADAARR